SGKKQRFHGRGRGRERPSDPAQRRERARARTGPSLASRSTFRSASPARSRVRAEALNSMQSEDTDALEIPRSRTSGAPRRLPEGGRSRAAIEGVAPEVDGGRFPIKRVVGERVEVEADVFA